MSNALNMKYLKCSTTCNNPATWTLGTWHCCDECAKRWVIETEKGWGYSPWGTSSRIGQKALLKHMLSYYPTSPLIIDKVKSKV